MKGCGAGARCHWILSKIMKVGMRRVTRKATPPNQTQRAEIVRLRDEEKMSWRGIAAHLKSKGRGISFQRVCQIYARVKEQTGQVHRVKNKEVIRTLKVRVAKPQRKKPEKIRLGEFETFKTKDLTPDTID